ncbi:probable potassium transporter 13 [Nymphaea colorata]|nr:probable potassium transporter 13 [Nymphaea colorata]XP_031505194.1 probable potassium transporter 13 [Nymphaea colorata]XP_031505195.1 probable potassium transporter 13 [Nymphaea colorata]XP_031505197.1 probable potassium transporter 13 [Nymphaea colorata]XP_031505198.1 probable potassium transporter 13 [Nymphaea colorata]XP_031505199.1 probable potassium transporter 13 [Nymphaea colorata]
MDMESGSPQRCTGPFNFLKKYRSTLILAYQSFGVVYGDLSTSPLYVYKSTFSGRLRLHEDDEEIFGVLSLIFWTLTLIPLLKYIILVLRADDNGEGGTFALYSLLSRHSRLSLLNTPQEAAEHLSAYSSEGSGKDTKTSALLKEFLEKSRTSRVVLLLVVMLGTSMVIGDGVLTPTMSVLAAISGVKVKVPNLHENHTVFLACIVLVGLFALQHYGTHRVGFMFAPILIAWLLCIGSVGMYNIFRWNPHIVRALSPYYIWDLFKKPGRDGWRSLGGIVMCITGAEAMFADLGHFSQLSIRIAFVGVVYPCLVLAYMGEAAYLSKHKADLQASFFRSIPEAVFWPVLVVATLATVVASQAIISATFSLINQCTSLKCFPRVKVIHTSNQIHGQIYIPEINWLLMCLCLAVVVGFRRTDLIGNAYGLAVITVMFVTTCIMSLVILIVWKRTVLEALAFVLVFGSLELLYLSACLIKVPKGGWLPLLLSLAFTSIMCTWYYGSTKKQEFELQNKVSLDQLLSMGPGLGMVRVPGICFIYSDIVAGIPPTFAHFVTNFPAFHQVLVFVSIKSVEVPRIPPAERFLIGRIGPKQYWIFRCIVRYGYKDVHKDSFEFEDRLVSKLAEFLQHEDDHEEWGGRLCVVGTPSNTVATAVERRRRVRFLPPGEECGMRDEVREFLEFREAGVAYIMGHTYVKAMESSSAIKKLLVNHVYGFLRRNCRGPAVALGIPHTSLIEVGMVYHV